VKLDPLRVRLEVPERDAHLVRSDQPVRVEIAGMPEPRAARVARAAPALTAAGRTLFVEIDLPNADHALRPGSFAAAEITVDPARAALTIPRDALVSFAGVEKVFVVADGVALERRVEVGRRDDARLEILSGLEPGTDLVAGPGNLRTGAPVVKAP
jgi:RND family efflux transporter MFP subunit